MKFRVYWSEKINYTAVIDCDEGEEDEATSAIMDRHSQHEEDLPKLRHLREIGMGLVGHIEHIELRTTEDKPDA